MTLVSGVVGVSLIWERVLELKSKSVLPGCFAVINQCVCFSFMSLNIREYGCNKRNKQL